MSKPARPKLRFANIDDMIAEVDRLKQQGYERTGQWDLPKMLDHLAKGFSIPFIDNPPMVPRIARPTVRFVIGVMVWTKYYPKIQLPAPRELCPTDGVSMEAAYTSFISSATRLRDYAGPTMRTPFGKMKSEKYRRLQLLHAAHHLRYLRGK